MFSFIFVCVIVRILQKMRVFVSLLWCLFSNGQLILAPRGKGTRLYPGDFGFESHLLWKCFFVIWSKRKRLGLTFLSRKKKSGLSLTCCGRGSLLFVTKGSDLNLSFYQKKKKIYYISAWSVCNQKHILNMYDKELNQT